MQSICLQKKCIECCRNTNMHLTHEDIHRIIQAGYAESYFSIERKGWIQLKNSKKRCIFHDGNYCQIYAIRPVGCRLYPIVYDVESKSAIYDKGCPFPSFLPLSKITIIQLKILISLLFNEREKLQIISPSDKTKKEK